MIFECETWPMKFEDMQKLNRADGMMLMREVLLKDRRSNEELR